MALAFQTTWGSSTCHLLLGAPAILPAVTISVPANQACRVLLLPASLLRLRLTSPGRHQDEQPHQLAAHRPGHPADRSVRTTLPVPGETTSPTAAARLPRGPWATDGTGSGSTTHGKLSVQTMLSRLLPARHVGHVVPPRPPRRQRRILHPGHPRHHPRISRVGRRPFCEQHRATRGLTPTAPH